MVDESCGAGRGDIDSRGVGGREELAGRAGTTAGKLAGL